MAKDFLLEIGTEPLPARFVQPALDQLRAGAEALLKTERLGFLGAQTFGTHRRLALSLSGLDEKSLPLKKEVTGPPARLLKGADGKFTAQAEGFARKQGLAPEKLETMDTPKGPFLVARLSVPGEPTAKILARLLPGLIGSLQFPKTLEWESSGFRFGRPIRTLAALFGKTVVPFKLAGLRSGRLVSGLPFSAPKPISLASAGAYRGALKDRLVLVDVEERRSVLLKRLENAAELAGGRLDADEALIDETVHMTEHPVPVAGSFEESYLALPPELLALVLKKQLKFFPLRGKNGLLPSFIGVRDGVSEGQAQVREGYERVLSARLSDAAFFLGRDRKTRLEDKLPMLARVTYQKALGTMTDKTARVRRLSEWLCEALSADPVDAEAVKDAASLCYADLVTEVVKEFPELQGVMGGFYARADGLGEKVALALEQFYFPAAAKGPVPATREAAIVSLAGKVDSLAGHFAAGNIPTGSADPFALRRQATGVLRILLEKQFPVDLKTLLGKAVIEQPGIDPSRREGIEKGSLEFIWVRAQTLFEEMGYRSDEIRSARGGWHESLSRTLLRIAAVHAVRPHPDFEALSAAYKRAANILRQAKFAVDDDAPLRRDALKEEAEVSLYDALAAVEEQVRNKLSEGQYEEGLRGLVTLKPDVDAFFEDVMVMVEDGALRRQRLALLDKLVRLFQSIADISEIQ